MGDMLEMHNMNKFKVGDRVRIIKEETGHRFKIGEIVKINRVNGANYYAVGDNDSWYVRDEEIESVGKARKVKQPKFLLKYEIDEDPWEEFQTLVAVKKRIKELEEEGAHSYKVYAVDKVMEVVISKQITIK